MSPKQSAAKASYQPEKTNSPSFLVIYGVCIVVIVEDIDKAIQCEGKCQNSFIETALGSQNPFSVHSLTALNPFPVYSMNTENKKGIQDLRRCSS